jgi:predicted methyltransferase
VFCSVFRRTGRKACLRHREARRVELLDAALGRYRRVTNKREEDVLKIIVRLACVAALATPLAASFADPGSPSLPAAAVANSDRPAEDKARDALRHPLELVNFAGLKQGDSVADFIPGAGYYTRIFSNLVGPKGHVYAIIPAELAAKRPQMATAMLTLSQTAPFTNVVPQVQPTAETGTGDLLDVVWTSDNYHDMYGFFGPDAAAAAVGSIFRALKPGGVFMVIDHVANAGAADAPTTLHRIDPAVVKAQVEAAGFKLEASSDILKNANDPHTEKVFAPDIRGRTDQFVFKFRKPG